MVMFQTKNHGSPHLVPLTATPWPLLTEAQLVEYFRQQNARETAHVRRHRGLLRDHRSEKGETAAATDDTPKVEIDDKKWVKSYKSNSWISVFKW
jgi:sRNA-binding protein